MPHNVAFHLVLHCLPKKHLGDTGIHRVQKIYCIDSDYGTSLRMPGYFKGYFLFSADFLLSTFQFWIQIKPDIYLSLIQVFTVCKGCH